MNDPFDFLATDSDDFDFAFWSAVAPPFDMGGATLIEMPTAEPISMGDVLTGFEAPQIPEIAATRDFDIGPVAAPAVFTLPPANVDVDFMLSDRTPQACFVG